LLAVLQGGMVKAGRLLREYAAGNHGHGYTSP
jgi:hypothetical protein